MNKYLKVLLLVFPILLYSAGGICNNLVTHANNGLMPVEIPEAYQIRYPAGTILDDEHVAASDTTLLRDLDDRILIGTSLYSIGDMLMNNSNLLAFVGLGITAIIVLIKHDKKNLSL